MRVPWNRLKIQRLWGRALTHQCTHHWVISTQHTHWHIQYSCMTSSGQHEGCKPECWPLEVMQLSNCTVLLSKQSTSYMLSNFQQTNTHTQTHTHTRTYFSSFGLQRKTAMMGWRRSIQWCSIQVRDSWLVGGALHWSWVVGGALHWSWLVDGTQIHINHVQWAGHMFSGPCSVGGAHYWLDLHWWPGAPRQLFQSQSGQYPPAATKQRNWHYYSSSSKISSSHFCSAS